jgi:glycine hydroxymethyltransferase
MKRGLNIVSGGTDNHLFLVDLGPRNFTGKDADAALGRANITVNKNAVPNDPRPPVIQRIAHRHPASTTRGFREAEVRRVADWIVDVVEAEGSDSVVQRVRAEVLELCGRFPVYRA